MKIHNAKLNTLLGEMATRISNCDYIWELPWRGINNRTWPMNAVTGNRYSGSNILVLLFNQLARDMSGNWASYNQWKKAGRQVKKGEIGTPIGFCAIKNNEIYQMYVSPAARGTNAAKALIQTGCDAIAKAGHAQAKLDVIAPNDRAQAFYRKMGFVSHGLQSVELDTLGDPFALDCVVMVKELE